jgi:hypothetical protein
MWTHERLLTKASIGSAIQDVAFRLDLPSLQNVPLSDLVRIRATEGEAFERFRDALGKASKELLHSKGLSRGDVALQIARDVIEPELRQLRQRLHAAKRLVNRKALVSIVLGGIATTCGFLGIIPAAIATSGGVGCILTGAGNAVYQYLEEKKNIELSDMYFIWKALRHTD